MARNLKLLCDSSRCLCLPVTGRLQYILFSIVPAKPAKSLLCQLLSKVSTAQAWPDRPSSEHVRVSYPHLREQLILHLSQTRQMSHVTQKILRWAVAPCLGLRTRPASTLASRELHLSNRRRCEQHIQKASLPCGALLRTSQNARRARVWEKQ